MFTGPDSEAGRPTASQRRPVVYVTGSAGGIGAAITERFATAGYVVAGLDLRQSQADLSLVGDLSDPAQAARLIRAAHVAVGWPDVLVTAAGIFEAATARLLTSDQWRRLLAVHLGGTVACIRAALPGMLSRGGGSIVTIASELALSGVASASHYGAAKGAIIGLTRSLGVELASRGVYVNCVAPGPTDTPMLTADSRTPEYIAGLPAGRLVWPSEIGAAVMFLASAKGAFVGQVVSPNAGAVI
jgi:2-hydroxycyclohexanecarboxyl-CoA dehydrogenase